MGKIKAGVVVVTEFCRPNDNRFQGYIDYINRSKAVRNKNTAKYNLYQDYMGNPNKTSGLFTSEKDNLSEDEKMQLKEIFEQAQSNESVMWQTVISFDNRWLKQNGIISDDDDAIDEAKLKEVARGGVNRMLEAEKLDNAVWSGAIHFNTDNIHIHIATVEPVPMREKKEYTQYEYAYQNGKRIRKPILDENGKPLTKMEYKGRFKPKSIEKCKSYVVNELVNDKENNIKINQIIRDSIVKQKSEHPLVQDEELVKLFEDLYQKMPDCNRNLWNYNNPIMARLRADIDNISTNYLEKYHSDEFKELRERINTQEEVYKQAYGDSKKDYGKNKMKDLYTRLGNAILKEIKKYDNELKNAEEKLGDNFVPLEKKEELYDSAFIQFSEMERKNPDDNLEYRIGMMYLNGQGTEQNNEKGKEYLEKSAEAKNVYAMNKLAKIYLEEKNIEMLPKALEYLKEAATVGKSDMAMYALGNVYSDNEYGMKDKLEAEKWYRMAEKEGNGYAAYKLGKLKIDDGNIREAVEHLSMADNKYAWYKLGKIYLNENEVMFNPEKGIMYMEKSAEEGNSFAQYQIGKIYNDGKYIERDEEKSMYWFGRASEQNNEYAAYQLGKIYYDKKDYPNSEQQFLKCENESIKPYSDYYLGKMYLDKDGKLFNPEKGIEYMERSAEAGNNTASFIIGITYLKGKVVKEDRTLGRQWIERAANEGNEYASEFLKNINQKSNNRGIGLRHARAMILSNATRALKKALKDEWQKRQNVREHEKLVEESIDI